MEEANARLEDLRTSLERIRDARRRLIATGERIRAHAGENGGGPEAGDYLEAVSVLRAELERLAEDDIILRDAETGLVDFPSLREGRVVQLCWRLGEDSVSHWHEVDAGFGSRQRL